MTAKRDKIAAKRFLLRAIVSNGVPELINIDKSGANKAAIVDYNKEHYTNTEVRQCKFLNIIAEQDHRGINRITRLIVGFKNFWGAQKILAGIELMRMLKTGQMVTPKGDVRSPAELFYSLAV